VSPLLSGVVGSRRKRDARNAPGRVIRSGHDRPDAFMSALRAAMIAGAVHVSRFSPDLLSASQIWPVWA